MKITLDFDINGQNNKLQIVVENFSEDANFDTIKFEITNQVLTEGSLNIIKYSTDSDNEIEISISVNGDIDSMVNTSINCEASNGLNISYEAETTFGEIKDKIVDLNGSTNCIVLNNYNKDQLQVLVSQISEQTIKVLGEKINKIFKGNDILSRAQRASEQAKSAQERERQMLEDSERQLNEIRSLNNIVDN